MLTLISVTDPTRATSGNIGRTHRTTTVGSSHRVEDRPRAVVMTGDVDRDLALERFGLLARLVLEHWGVRRSADIGDIVFTMVELGLLLTQPTDTRDEFADAFDFDDAFESDYPWNCESVA